MKNLTIISLNQKDIKDFSTVRNQALSSAKTKWILFLDQDENLTLKLKKEIKKVIQNNKYNYQFKRVDWFLGKKLRFGETRKFRSVRLVQKNTGNWRGLVHEEFVSSLPVKTLSNPIIHNRNISVNQFLDRLNSYSTLKAKEEENFSYLKLMVYPSAKFALNYFFYLGFLDGIPGLTMAFCMSLHSFMVRVKLYEKNH